MLQELLNNWPTYLVAVQAFLSGVVAVSLLLPGDQPEKALQWVLDLLKKFSKK